MFWSQRSQTDLTLGDMFTHIHKKVGSQTILH